MSRFASVSLALVGRVVWVKGKALGIQLLERLNFNSRCAPPTESWVASQASKCAPGGQDDPPPPRRPCIATAPASWLAARRTTITAGICAALTLWQIRPASLTPPEMRPEPPKPPQSPVRIRSTRRCHCRHETVRIERIALEVVGGMPREHQIQPTGLPCAISRSVF